MSNSWIDISLTIKPGMAHWPSNPPVEIRPVKSIAQGASSNISHLAFGSHTGTHMDAPRHFLAQGDGIDRLDLEAVIGPARVIEISDRESIKPQELKAHNIAAGERLLFKTHNSSWIGRCDQFREEFVYMTGEAGEFLAERRVRCVGIDYLSVGGYRKDGTRTHQALLTAGIWIIEGLDLSPVPAGSFELICLPLKILDGDGAPARAVVKPIA